MNIENTLKRIVIWLFTILGFIVLLNVGGLANAYDFDDLKREVQDASMDCRNVEAGQLWNGTVYVHQYCTLVTTDSVTTTKKTLMIDFERLRWKRFIGFKFE